MRSAYMRIYKPFFWLAAFMLVIGLACGFSAGNIETIAPPEQQETQPPPPQVTEASEPTKPPQETVEPAGGAINSLDQVQDAVIQIEAQGTYVNPDFTVSYNTAGYGSGFIIDPSGIAITNNH